MIYTSVYILVQNILMWTHGQKLMGGAQQFDWKKIVTTPAIAAILAGFFLVALDPGVQLPLPPGAETTAEHPVGVSGPRAVRLTAGLTGIALGLNLWNALVIAVLGLPGFVLLLLVQWVL
mgnify:CR=1 FL=1